MKILCVGKFSELEKYPGEFKFHEMFVLDIFFMLKIFSFPLSPVIFLFCEKKI